MAVGSLGHAITDHPEAFNLKDDHAMEWYYPVLGGALRGAAATARIDERWDRFVVPGLGIRCVDHRPWVTGAETCELVMALDAIGESARAREQFAAMHHLREEDGSYWTGLVLLRRQALARGAHHVDRRGDESLPRTRCPRRRRAAASSAPMSCLAALKVSSTALAQPLGADPADSPVGSAQCP